MRIASDELEEMLRPYGRHLVGLTCLAQPIDRNGEPSGLASPRFYSGFVIRYFMTGFPADSYERSMVRTQTAYRVHGNAVPSATHIEKIEFDDSQMPSAYRQFVVSSPPAQTVPLRG